MALGSEFGIAFLKLGNEIGLALRGLGSLTGRALAKYPLLTNLVDSVLGYTGTLTRSTVKTYYTDSGAIASAAINAAAFTGSGVLLEPADTNVCIYSNDFSNAAWTKSNCTITTGQADPNGGTTGYKMTVSAAGAAAIVSSNYTYSGSVRHALLVVKKGTCAYLNVRLFDVPITMAAKVCINLTTMAVSDVVADPGATYTSTTFTAIGNGFYLIDINYTVSGTGGVTYAYASNNATANTVDGTAGETLFLYFIGAQQKSTSPIITSGVALTRTVDELTVPTTNWLTNEFTLYTEWTPKAAIIASSINNIYRNDYGGSDYTAIYYVEATGLLTLISLYGGVGRSVTISLTPVVGTKYKITASFSTSGITFDVNGTSGTASAQNGIIHTATSYLGSNGVAGINGTISNFKYINGVVTATQAEAL